LFELAPDALFFAAILQEDPAFAEGADPWEVTEDGADPLLEEADALCSR
jgi:hypothetical protein